MNTYVQIYYTEVNVVAIQTEPPLWLATRKWTAVLIILVVQERQVIGLRMLECGEVLSLVHLVCTGKAS